jgi:hypothetical protein
VTTRKELLGHVRTAIRDICEEKGVPAAYLSDEEYDEMAFAAIESVYKAIGDHQLALLIGDTGPKPGPRGVNVSGVAESGKIELLQDDDEDDET